MANLIRRLSAMGLRRGLSGNRVWLVVGITAAGIRVLRSLAKNDEEILYRTAVKAGDVFEIVTKAPPK